MKPNQIDGFSFKKVTGKSLFTTYFKVWKEEFANISINPLPIHSSDTNASTLLIEDEEIPALKSATEAICFESALQKLKKGNFSKEKDKISDIIKNL